VKANERRTTRYEGYAQDITTRETQKGTHNELLESYTTRDR
jgi:hypothetical protein